MGVSNLPLVLTGNQESLGLFLILSHSETVSEKKEEADLTLFAGHKIGGFKPNAHTDFQLR